MTYPPPSYLKLYRDLHRSMEASRLAIGQLQIDIAELTLQVNTILADRDSTHAETCKAYEERITYLQNENHLHSVEAERTISQLRKENFNMHSRYNTEVSGLIAIIKLRIYEYDLHKAGSENLDPQNSRSADSSGDPRLDLLNLEMQIKALPRLDPTDSHLHLSTPPPPINRSRPLHSRGLNRD